MHFQAGQADSADTEVQTARLAAGGMSNQALDTTAPTPLSGSPEVGAPRGLRKRWAVVAAVLLLLIPALLYEWYQGFSDLENLESLFGEAIPEAEMSQWAVGGPKSLAQLGDELGALAGSGGHEGAQVGAALWTEEDLPGGSGSSSGDHAGGPSSGGGNSGGGDESGPALMGLVPVGGGSPIMIAALENPNTGGPSGGGGGGGGEETGGFTSDPDNPDPEPTPEPVPEPGTLSLLALGGAVAALSRRLRRSR